MLPQEKWKTICLSSEKHHRHTFVGWWGVFPYDTLPHRFKSGLRVQFKQTFTFTTVGGGEMWAVYLKGDSFQMETRQMSHSAQELINKLLVLHATVRWVRQAEHVGGSRLSIVHICTVVIGVCDFTRVAELREIPLRTEQTTSDRRKLLLLTPNINNLPP